LESWRAAAAVVLLAVYSVARYRDVLLSFFFLDDFWLLRTGAEFPWGSLFGFAQVFRPTHVGFQLYRPLTQTGYFALLWPLCGTDATGYHAVQLLMFVAAVLLVFAIVRRLTGSVAAATGAGLIYATAPGHAVAVFWLAAFTMIGTALAVFLMIWAWLRIDDPRPRAIVCTVLQVVALLCSEHAIVAPVLVAAVDWAARRGESWRQRLRLLAPSVAVVAIYASLKVWYFARFPMIKEGYETNTDLIDWITRAGHYALGAVNALQLTRGAEPGDGGLVLGMALLIVLAVALWQGRRGVAAWRLIAAGVAIFYGALLPVLPLTAHFFDYFVGIAALGLAVAVIGICQLLAPRHWAGIVLGIGIALAAFDIATGQRAVRHDPIFDLVGGGSRAAASWLNAVSRATDVTVKEAVVPTNAVTEAVFKMGHAERLFPKLPPLVIVQPRGQRPAAIPFRAIVPRDDPEAQLRAVTLPGWTPRYAWLRAFARWAGSPGRTDIRDEDPPFFEPMASSDSPQLGARRCSKRSHGMSTLTKRA